MRTKEDKLVKILLDGGLALHLYAPPATVDEMIYHPKFLSFKDNDNDSIYISLESISGFEVLDDRKKEEISPASDPDGM